MRIEAPIALKGLVGITPEKHDLGSMRKSAIKLERGSERFRFKRGYSRGVRPRGSRRYCGHSECRSRGRRCMVGSFGFSTEITI